MDLRAELIDISVNQNQGTLVNMTISDSAEKQRDEE